jgi:hypothetical protein
MFCISGLYRLRMVGYRLCVVIAGIVFCFIVRCCVICLGGALLRLMMDEVGRALVNRIPPYSLLLHWMLY